MRKLVIGVTGPLGGGRTTVAQRLASRGFTMGQLSGILRDEARRRGDGNPDIEQLQDLGDELRGEKGPHVLAQLALERAEGESVVLDGIKNPGEALWLEGEAEAFYLLGVDASSSVREKRKVGGGPGQLSKEEFDRAEARDREETDAWGVLVEQGQQVGKCVHMADFLIWNDELLLRGRGGESSQDGSMDSLKNKVDRMLETVQEPARDHPSDREVFMAQAVVASRRSECMQRKVGAVVASTDNRVLAVGRNDAPWPLKSCWKQFGMCYRQKIRDEQLEALSERVLCKKCGGALDKRLRCPACQVDHSEAFKQFRNLDLCHALHAEETALLQVARSGGRPRADLHVYATTFPCSLCARRIVSAGVDTVFYVDPYPGQESFDALRQSDVRVIHFEGFTLRGIEKVWGKV